MSIGTQHPTGSSRPGRRRALLPDQGSLILLALLPGAALHAWISSSGVLVAIGCAIAWALLQVPANGTRDAMHAVPRNRQSSAVLMGALCALWLPPTVPWWTFAISIFVAVAIVRVFRDRPGASPFHPAIAGCAIALVFTQHLRPAAFDIAMSTWIAVAYGCGGLALVVARRIRWDVPLTVLATTLIVGCALLALPSPWLPTVGGSTESTASAVQQLLPALVLTTFFIASDPSSGCVLPRARWLSGIGTGLLMLVAFAVSSEMVGALLGFAGAVLLMNAAAPWLDRISRRTAPARLRTDTDLQ